ncbi:hypothetical protein N234_37100 [Ralstonia pickettii DTP0602]|nr:hypothetical protein N234_37100 [Ralstonia pickettii DTP0602]
MAKVVVHIAQVDMLVAHVQAGGMSQPVACLINAVRRPALAPPT